MREKQKLPLAHAIKPERTEIIGAFDIETNGVYGNYLDGFVKYEDDDTYYRASTMGNMLDILLSRWDVILYAHFGQGYEFNYLKDELIGRDLECDAIIQGDSGLIGMVIKDESHKIELRDSYALIPMGLGKATQAFKCHTQKGNIGLGEGYIYNPLNERDVLYCKMDVQATIEIVQAFENIVDDLFGCGFGWSTASTALHTWKTTLIPRITAEQVLRDPSLKEQKGQAYWRMTESQEKFCREAYYGGFVFPGSDIHKHDDVISIDRNAAYAAAMRIGVPIGKPKQYMTYQEGKLGIYQVEVTSDETATIPCVASKINGTLLWAKGEYQTYITSVEMEFASKHGYHFEVISGLVWDEVAYPFNAFVDKCEKVEVEEPDKKPVSKLMRNGLYGKFGSKILTKDVRICKNSPGEDWVPLRNEETGEFQLNIWENTKESTAEYIQPHWAAFITAYERLWMWDVMDKVGMKYVRYGDTDSVKADGWRVHQLIKEGKIEISNKYGDAKIDEEYTWFQSLGPKVYRGVLKDGSNKFRAKGIPTKYLNHKLYDDAYESPEKMETVEFMSANKVLTRLKNQKLGMKKQGKRKDGSTFEGVQRKLTDYRKSKTWKVDEKGRVHQPELHLERLWLDLG
jgi:hypothetical protein